MILAELAEQLLERRPEPFPSMVSPAAIRFMAVPGSIEGGTSTFLAFADGVETPICAVKIYRHADAELQARNEKETLSALEASSNGLAGTVPRLIHSARLHGKWVLVESYLRGSPMQAGVGKDGLPQEALAAENLSLIADWLIRVHQESRARASSAATVMKSWQGLIDSFSRTFELCPEERALAAELREGVSRLPHARFCIEHGDLCRQNILVDADSPGCPLGVIDWSESSMTGLPLADLLYFAGTYAVQGRRREGLPGFLEPFEHAFLTPNRFSLLVKSVILRYCGAAGIDPVSLRVLFPLFLVQRALFQHRQMSRCAKTTGLPRFSLNLAARLGQSLDQAVKMPIWREFLRAYLARRDDFIILRD